jgi:hypothetical protein
MGADEQERKAVEWRRRDQGSMRRKKDAQDAQGNVLLHRLISKEMSGERQSTKGHTGYGGKEHEQVLKYHHSQRGILKYSYKP